MSTFDDVGPWAIRLSDGHGDEICSNFVEIDAYLYTVLEWANEPREQTPL